MFVGYTVIQLYQWLPEANPVTTSTIVTIARPRRVSRPGFGPSLGRRHRVPPVLWDMATTTSPDQGNLSVQHLSENKYRYQLRRTRCHVKNERYEGFGNGRFISRFKILGRRTKSCMVAKWWRNLEPKSAFCKEGRDAVRVSASFCFPTVFRKSSFTESLPQSKCSPRHRTACHHRSRVASDVLPPSARKSNNRNIPGHLLGSPPIPSCLAATGSQPAGSCKIRRSNCTS